MRQWTSQEIRTLDRLRQGFLSGTAGQYDYWKSEEELSLYNRTFAERIGWKWDAVIFELKARGWKPRSRRIVDWGCGTGVAGRRVLQAWEGQFDGLHVYDRSPLAMRFAAREAVAANPGLKCEMGAPPRRLPPDTMLVLSHVLNELPPHVLRELLSLAASASEILWVEAGTHADSRLLTTEIRERLREQFAAVGPCTHSARCGMCQPENERHWCHFFAPVPPAVFQDASWAEFSRELGIDLRALPYSFIALERPQPEPVVPLGYSRVIGEAREFKGHVKLLSCQAEGVTEFMLQKRDLPELHKSFLKRREELPVYAWEIREGKIVEARPLPPPPADRREDNSR